MAIVSFGNAATVDFFNGIDTSKSKKLAQGFEGVARRKLDMMNAEALLDDLKVPPGNRLEALKGDRARYHSIRINQQWRVVFRRDSGAHGVTIEDYH